MTLTLDQALKLVQKLSGQIIARRPGITELDDYYRGKQPLKYASKQWREYNGVRYKDFSDNWCGVVANAPVERLQVMGFRLPGNDVSGKRLMTPDENLLWRDWSTNACDVQSAQGFLTAIVNQRSYVLVWGNSNNEPLVTWEDPSQMIVAYDPENPRRRIAALKLWTDDETKFDHATLYTDDEVWKFQRHSGMHLAGNTTQGGLLVIGDVGSMAGLGGWVPRKPEADDTWPLENPMGVVPVVEFPNRPMLRGEPLSDISGTASMQDAINLLWAYLFAAADQASYPGRVITGQEMPTMPILDDAGQVIGSKPIDMGKLEQGRFLWLSNPGAKIDHWEPAKLDVFTSVIEIQVGHVGAQTRTPPHYLVANKGLSNLNADALTAAEVGLGKKVEEEQLFFSPPLRETNALMALARGNKKLAAAAREGTPRWKDPHIRSEAQRADALLKDKAVGFPFRWIAEQRGLTDPEIDRVMAMRAEELAMDPLAFTTPELPGNKNNPSEFTEQ